MQQTLSKAVRQKEPGHHPVKRPMTAHIDALRGRLRGTNNVALKGPLTQTRVNSRVGRAKQLRECTGSEERCGLMIMQCTRVFSELSRNIIVVNATKQPTN